MRVESTKALNAHNAQNASIAFPHSVSCQNSTEQDRPRRGLVLQGGGAKGAFQYGVIKELHENGIQFDAIAGTSVGALNGAILSAGAWKVGDDLWGNLAIERIFSTTWLATALAILSMLGRMYVGYVTMQYNRLLPRAIRIYFHTITVIPTVLFIICVTGGITMMETSWWRWLVPIWGTALCVAGVGGVIRSPTARFQVFFGCFFVLVFVIPICTLMGVLEEGATFPSLSVIVTHMTHSETFSTVLFLGLLCLLYSSSSLFIIGKIAQRVRISFFENRPLRALAHKVASDGFCIPLFATSGEEIPEYYDPDDYEYTKLSSKTGYWFPEQRVGFRAIYERVDLLPAPEAASVLVTSAALPLGIVGCREMPDGRRRVDGGVIDNTPWFPLVELLPCDELVVVLCGSEEDDARIDIDKLRERERLSRVFDMEFKPPSVHLENPWDSPIRTLNKPPVVVPYHESFRLPQRVVLISPECPVGNLLTGTLNFSAQKARANIEAGRSTARKYIATIHAWHSSGGEECTRITAALHND